MTGQYRLRPAVNEDIPQIIELAKAATTWEDYIPQVISEWIQDTRGEVIVVEADGRVVGVARYYFQTPHIIWMQGLRVHPSHRGLGLSDRIALECMGRARERGASGARLATSRRNIPSRRHVERVGFKLMARWIVLGRSKRGEPHPHPEPSLAGDSEVEELWRYLRTSPAYRRGGGLYGVGAVWFDLDRQALASHVAAGECFYYGPAAQPRALALAGPARDETGRLGFRVKYAEGEASTLREVLEHARHLSSERGLDLYLCLPKFRGWSRVLDRREFEWASEMLIYSRSLL